MALATAGMAPTQPASPQPLTPSGLVLRRHRVRVNCQRADVVGTRHRIVHERAGDELTGIGIEMDILHQDLADALRHAAGDLAVDQERVDDGADVVHHAVAHDLDRAGLLDRSRPRRHGRRSGSSRFPGRRPRSAIRLRSMPFRQFRRIGSGARDVADGDGLVGLLRREYAVFEFQVVDTDLEHMRGNLLAPFR